MKIHTNNFIFKYLLFFTLSLFSFNIYAENLPDYSGADWMEDMMCTTSYALPMATITPVNNGFWNAGSTWSTGQLPTAADIVIIPEGFDVVMLGTMRAKQLIVHGTLRAVNWQAGGAWINLETEYILVDGAQARFEIGTEAQAYQATEKCVITLIGPDDGGSVGIMGDKFLAAMNGATIEMHGENKLSWTEITETAQAGAVQIKTNNPVDWYVGDDFVIASTDFDANQAEKRTITNISADGRTISFAEPLSYMHYGVIETHGNGVTNYDINMRAEVGLLTRNIKIQGSADSEAAGFGGHMMTMPGTQTRVSHIELYRMGQKGIIGRYPFHWHLLGDAQGQYIKHSSIHRSYNRVITVHGTDNTVVENNVGFDHIGHGFFLEDGDEEGNLFKNNLGILTKKPQPGEETRPHDLVLNGNLFELPATYWITNPNNDFIGNVAAGSEGSGFWMVMLNEPLRNPGTWGTYKPAVKALGIFDDNKSHSTSFSNFGIDGGVNSTTHEFGNGHYRPENADGSQNIPQINRFTGYKCQDRNVWMRANTMHFRDCRFSDNSRHTFFAYNQIIFNSLLVGKSDNIGTITTASETTAGRSLPLPSGGINNGNNTFRGHSIYDGSSGIIDCHFAGYDSEGAKAYAFQTNGAAQKSTAHFASGISFADDIPLENKIDFTPGYFRDYSYASGLLDLDGSLTGVVGARLTPHIGPLSGSDYVNEPGFNHAPEAVYVPEWGASYDIGHDYALARLDNGWAQDSSTPIFALRSDGKAVYNRQTFGRYSQNPVIVNEGYKYYWQYTKLANRIRTNFHLANEGDSYIAVFPNVPSTLTINDAIQKNSLSELESAAQSAYFFADNTAYVKVFATTRPEGTRRQFGERSYQGSTQICVNQDCSDAAGRTTFMTLADYERGDDSRDYVAALPGVGITQPVYDASNPTVDPFDDIDQSASWTVTSDADGTNEYADYHLSFPRQIWTDFYSLNIDYSGPPMSIYIKDEEEGYTFMGKYDENDSGAVSLGQGFALNLKDNITKIILRVQEEDLGALNQINQGDITLRGIYLNADPSDYSTPIDNIYLALSDSDGDGLNDFEEAENCRDPFNANDLNIEFYSTNQGFQNNQITAQIFTAEEWLLRSDYNNDPFIYKSGFNMDGNQIKKIRVLTKSQASGSYQIYWATEAQNSFSGTRVKPVAYTTSGSYTELEFDMTGHPEWEGQTITQLRLDFPINVDGQIHTWLKWIKGTQENSLTIETLDIQNAACAEETGRFLVLANGGVGQIDYTIEPAATVYNLRDFRPTAGTYTVTATDANGCSVSVTETIGEQTLAVLTSQTAVDGANLQNGNSVEACIEQEISFGFTGEFNNEWNFTFVNPNVTTVQSGNAAAQAEQFSFSMTAADFGQWQVTYTNPDGCSETVIFTVNQADCDPCLLAGGDSDNDGVCNNEDCQPNNPNFPATPGTTCNDNNTSTVNDVIQADGCACAGTFDPCATAGGDSDNDGVCNNEDCQPNNPNFPATPGTTCNDNNESTVNDVIQADGCTCVGEDLTPDCNDIDITTNETHIIVTGLDGAPVSSVQVFSQNWQTEYNCFANCGATASVPVSPGEYYIYVRYYSANYQYICQKFTTVTVVNDTESSEPDCANIEISPTEEGLEITGLQQAPISSLQIFNQSWQYVYNCFGNCDDTETVTLPSGTYYVYAKYYSAAYQQLCVLSKTVQVINAADLRSIIDTDFKAEQFLEHVETFWIHTRSEAVENYVLERSLDGTNFKETEIVPSSGINGSELYRANDLAPEIGDNYYRLRIDYLNGTTEWLDPQLVNYIDRTDFVLFPNPADSQVTISLEKAIGLSADIQIYDNLGRQLFAEHIEEVSEAYHTLDISDFNEGHYVVWLNVSGKRAVAKPLIIGHF